jgi:hypothetical protein
MFLDGEAAPGAARPPIAQVAGASAAEAALEAVTAELREAEEEGRMIRALPLETVETGFLRRDRLQADPEEMAALRESLRARGQQTPIEVQALAPGEDGAPRWGLISGWRRMLALKGLFEETGEARFGTVLALVRRPEAMADAYVAMIEENEIRAGISFYERARVVRRAVEAGVYDSEKQALQSLFSTASAPKRSKIKSFIPIVERLDGVLAFPTHIPERTGLALSKALAEDAGFAARLEKRLSAARPETPEAEAAVLAKALKGPGAGPPAPQPGVRLRESPGKLVLDGAGVDAAFTAKLKAWLAEQGV